MATATLVKKIILFTIVSYLGTLEAEADGLQVKDRYYPRYHLAPPYGWMNDPNGFCVFNGEYHLFYQHNPNSSFTSTVVHWGHAKSPDLVNWEHLPIAMYPDKWYDAGGVFSGSAFVENDTMYLFYTGNILSPVANRQALATSTDGVTVTKYEGNPIINGTDRQPSFRDPKVWKYGETYYMVLGNSYNNDSLGRVLLYSSRDKIIWNEVSVIDQSNGTLGYMWECPDFFELDGKYVLMFSPQGVAPQGDNYKNLFQTGYIVGDFDYSTLKFTPTSDFKELDHGHDFYATQSILDNRGRRIVIAWLDMWEENYPERYDGFTGLMTLPRELALSSSGTIIQKPVEEISQAISRRVLPVKARGKSSRIYTLKNKAGEINVRADRSKDLKLYIESDKVRVTLSYNAAKGQVTLNRGGKDGVRRTEWKPSGRQLKWRIFVDASSIELFCGEGEVTFSSRFFPDGPIQIRLGEKSRAKYISVNEILRTVPRGGDGGDKCGV